MALEAKEVIVNLSGIQKPGSCRTWKDSRRSLGTLPKEAEPKPSGMTAIYRDRPREHPGGSLAQRASIEGVVGNPRRSTEAPEEVGRIDNRQVGIAEAICANVQACTDDWRMTGYSSLIL